jgi:hypothetical protein
VPSSVSQARDRSPGSFVFWELQADASPFLRRAVKHSLFPVLLDTSTHILDRAYLFTDGTCCVLLVAGTGGYRSYRKPLSRDLSRIVQAKFAEFPFYDVHE